MLCALDRLIHDAQDRALVLGVVVVEVHDARCTALFRELLELLERVVCAVMSFPVIEVELAAGSLHGSRHAVVHVAVHFLGGDVAAPSIFDQLAGNLQDPLLRRHRLGHVSLLVLSVWLGLVTALVGLQVACYRVDLFGVVGTDC